MTDCTLKIQTLSGGEIEVPARECEKCDGTGILREAASIEWRSANDLNDVNIVEAKAGDRCIFCNGHGKIAVAGGPPRPIKRKPSEIN